MSVFTEYCLRDLNRRPPREISSQVTMSSPKANVRTQALKFTFVRRYFRLFAGRKVGWRSAGESMDSGSSGSEKSGSSSIRSEAALPAAASSARFQTVEEPQFLQKRTMPSLTI